jgi:hypothetical protein
MEFLRILGFGCYALDCLTKQQGKTFVTRTSVPLNKIIPVVAKNHFLALVNFETTFDDNSLNTFTCIHVACVSSFYLVWIQYLVTIYCIKSF